MALAGLALVGTAGYLLAIGQQPFVDSTAHYGWTAWIPLVFGLVVIVLAACACCCNSVGWSVCCIFLLALLLLLFGAVVIASGSILVVLSEEYLPTISSSASATEGKRRKPCRYFDETCMKYIAQAFHMDLLASSRKPLTFFSACTRVAAVVRS